MTSDSACSVRRLLPENGGPPGAAFDFLRALRCRLLRPCDVEDEEEELSGSMAGM